MGIRLRILLRVRDSIRQFLHNRRRDTDPLVKLGGLDAPTADIEQMLAEIASGRG